MNFKVYLKKGNTNYKEKRMVKNLTDALTKKFEANPSLASTFRPAATFEELQKLHDEHTFEGEDVEYTEVKDNEQNQQEMDTTKENDQEQEVKEVKVESGKSEAEKLYDDSDHNDQGHVDPMNREEPIVRDYVTNNDLPPEGEMAAGTERTSFGEPLTFEQAFEMPEERTINGGGGKGNNTNNDNGNGGNNRQNQSQGQPKKETINPSFNDMGNGKQKRSTKKFAKYIVEAVCMLSEKGFVWFANKDINEEKLAEYELSGEIDLRLLVTLENGQEATVKQFFQQQCFKAEHLAKIDEEEKKDLIEALAEVLMEKGVAPTPTQELILIAGKIIGGQALTLLTIKSQTGSLLAQLRAMKSEETEYEEQPREQPKQRQRQTPPPVEEPNEEEHDEHEEEGNFDDLEREMEKTTAANTKQAEPEVSQEVIIEKPIETKE